MRRNVVKNGSVAAAPRDIRRSTAAADARAVQPLDFELDAHTRADIDAAVVHARALADSVQVRVVCFRRLRPI